MTNQELTQLSDEQLLKHAKVINKTKMYDAFIMGLLIGIAVYSSVRNGFGLLTLLPLLYPPIAARNMKQREMVDSLIKERRLID